MKPKKARIYHGSKPGPIVIKKPAPKPKIVQNGVSRPRPIWSDGTPKVAHRVWEIADEISAKHAQDTIKAARETKKKQPPALPASRVEVLKVCTAEKIPYYTFVNEFYSWRRFNGLNGRIRKDGKPAKPMGYQGKKPRKNHWKEKKKDAVKVVKPGKTVATKPPFKPVTKPPFRPTT